MDRTDVSRAVGAATSIVEGLGLTVEAVRVLQNSNKLSLRLLPCDVFARVAHVGHEVARLEVEIALRLAETRSPVAALDPRAEPRPYEHGGFVVTLWTYYPPVADRPVSPAAYATALTGLHTGMRALDITTPHFTARVDEAQDLVGNRRITPALAEHDRGMLGEILGRLKRVIGESGGDEQLLHGEPHPGNVVDTDKGLRFVDLETCCRGPLEFDLAHVPEDVVDRYPNVDRVLLHNCRELVLAMVAAWRFDRDDQLPNRDRAAQQLLAALHAGPPWPTLDVMGD